MKEAAREIDCSADASLELFRLTVRRRSRAKAMSAMGDGCPLYPSKQTSIEGVEKSASGQCGHRDGVEECLLVGVKQTSQIETVVSAEDPKRTYK